MLLLLLLLLFFFEILWIVVKNLFWNLRGVYKVFGGTAKWLQNQFLMECSGHTWEWWQMGQLNNSFMHSMKMAKHTLICSVLIANFLKFVCSLSTLFMKGLTTNNPFTYKLVSWFTLQFICLGSICWEHWL